MDKIEKFTPVNDRGAAYANANELIRAWALQEKGKAQDAEKRLQDWATKEPVNETAQWVMKAYNNNEPKDKLPDDENIRLLTQIMELQ